MLGMAIGEALGAPFEGLTHEQIQERAGRVEGFVDPRRVQSPARSGYFQLAVYEDETQVALAAADVIIRNGHFQPEAFRDRLEELGQPIDGNAFGCFRRARRNLRTSVRKMLKGATWEQSGVNTAGSGAASRGVPIGIFYRNDEKGLIRAAIEAALVTHRDPRSVCAAVAMAKGVALALEADPAKFDVAAFVQALHATCRAAEDSMEKEYAPRLQQSFGPFLHQFSEAMLLLPELATLDLEPAFAKIVAHAAGKGGASDHAGDARLLAHRASHRVLLLPDGTRRLRRNGPRRGGRRRKQRFAGLSRRGAARRAARRSRDPRDLAGRAQERRSGRASRADPRRRAARRPQVADAPRGGADAARSEASAAQEIQGEDAARGGPFGRRPPARAPRTRPRGAGSSLARAAGLPGDRAAEASATARCAMTDRGGVRRHEAVAAAAGGGGGGGARGGRGDSRPRGPLPNRPARPFPRRDGPPPRRADGGAQDRPRAESGCPRA